VVLRQEHKAGEKMFVDWAGATIPVWDRHTDQAWPSALFVAALGASSYTSTEAMRDQQMESWLRHIHAFEHFHGHPGVSRSRQHQERRPYRSMRRRSSRRSSALNADRSAETCVKVSSDTRSVTLLRKDLSAPVWS
jgi:hypothetical protein